MSRDELYALVWQTPIQQLAAKFGCSDTALRKRCRRLKIPVPPRGYWQKRNSKKIRSPRRPKLPPAQTTVSEQVLPFEFASKRFGNQGIDADAVREALMRLASVRGSDAVSSLLTAFRVKGARNAFQTGRGADLISAANSAMGLTNSGEWIPLQEQLETQRQRHSRKVERAKFLSTKVDEYDTLKKWLAFSTYLDGFAIPGSKADFDLIALEVREIVQAKEMKLSRHAIETEIRERNLLTDDDLDTSESKPIP